LLRAGRSQELAVGADAEAEDAVAMAFQRALALAGADLPDRDDFVETGGNQLARRDEPLAIRAKRDAARPFTASFCIVCAHIFAGRRVPEYDLLVPAGRGQPFAVRAEGDGFHAIL